MSSLAAKSGTWVACLAGAGTFPVDPKIYYLKTLTYPNNARYSIFGNSANSAGTASGLSRVDFYLNGAQRAKYLYKPSPATANQTYVNSVAVNPAATTLHYIFDYTDATFGQRGGILKTTIGGDVISAKYLPASTTYANSSVVDAAGNCYFLNRFLQPSTGEYDYGIVSVDTNLAWRWGRCFQRGAPNFYNTLCSIAGTNSAGNLCVVVREYVTEARAEFRYMQIAPSTGDIVAISGSYYVASYYQTFTVSSNASGQLLLNMNSDSSPSGLFMFNGNCTPSAFRTFTFNGTNRINVGAFKILNDGTVYLAATAGTSPDYTLVIIKMTFAGTILWVRGMSFEYLGPGGGTAPLGLLGGLEVTGDNESLITVPVQYGAVDEYGTLYGESGVVTVRADGSGVGTYSGGDRRFNYYVETRVAMGSASYVTSGVTRTWTYFSTENTQPLTVDTLTPATTPSFVINI
jgi:hypothetical protein